MQSVRYLVVQPEPKMVLSGAQATGYLELHVAIALVTHIVVTGALDTRINPALTLKCVSTLFAQQWFAPCYFVGSRYLRHLLFQCIVHPQPHECGDPD